MITQKTYKSRRQQLFDHMCDNSVAIILAANPHEYSNDLEYPYRQNTDFLYLTGFKEPKAIAVFVKEESNHSFILFCQDHDPKIEVVSGNLAGIDGAVKDFGANEAFPISEVDERMPELLKNKKRLYYPYGRNTEFDIQLMQWLSQCRPYIRQGFNMIGEIYNLDDIVCEMRLIKSDEEITIMQKAINICVEAQITAIQSCKPDMYEYEIAALIEYVFKKHGALHPSFETIVGTGNNSCILHTIKLADQIKDGDIVLLDCGCEYHDYISDLTRTFPANSKFTKEQLAIYDIVLKAQLAGIEQMIPGNPYIAAQIAATRIIVEGLVDLGILKGDVNDLIKQEAYKPFYMHHFGHWMGMDAHDYALYKPNNEWRLFQPGMMMSAEPGIYIAQSSKNVDQKWLGIGIRIEDDVLITENGNKILSEKLPKTAEAIEKLMLNN